MAKKKQFKTESKKILDLMINSVYTNKENKYFNKNLKKLIDKNENCRISRCIFYQVK